MGHILPTSVRDEQGRGAGFELSVAGKLSICLGFCLLVGWDSHGCGLVSPRYYWWFIWEVTPGSSVSEWGSETENLTETPVCASDRLSLDTTGVSSCMVAPERLQRTTHKELSPGRKGSERMYPPTPVSCLAHWGFVG